MDRPFRPFFCKISPWQFDIWHPQRENNLCGMDQFSSLAVGKLGFISIGALSKGTLGSKR